MTWRTSQSSAHMYVPEPDDVATSTSIPSSAGKRTFSGHCGLHSEALLPSDAAESTPTKLCARHAPILLRRLAA